MIASFVHLCDNREGLCDWVASKRLRTRSILAQILQVLVTTVYVNLKLETWSFFNPRAHMRAHTQVGAGILPMGTHKVSGVY